MKKLLILSVLIFLSGCATTNNPRVEIVDPECDQLVDIAEGMAKLRDIGYTLDNLNSFINQPSVQKVPIQSLKLYVYNLNKSSDDVKDHFHKLCYNVGFKEFTDYLILQERVISAEIALNNLSVKVGMLEKENAMLMQQVKIKRKK